MRKFIPTAGIPLLFLLLITPLAFAQNAHRCNTNLTQRFKILESDFEGRLGVFAQPIDQRNSITYRANERFPMQSTFKVLLVAAILKKGTTDPHLLQKKIHYRKEDIVTWSPITEKHLQDGMTVLDLCHAAISYSDNTATNLLLTTLGGIQSLNQFARAMGDNVFKLNHWEPDLNSNPTRNEDTTTPQAMAHSLQKLLFGKVLTSEQRQQLLEWMLSNTTGDGRIRAGVSKHWKVADKTGSSSAYGVTNAIGVVWPANGVPILLTLYFVRNKMDGVGSQNSVLAKATQEIMACYRDTHAP